MSSIAERIHQLRLDIPDDVRIVAVSKFHPIEKLLQAYDAGQRLFGESRQQELLQKIPLMPDDTVWHFIGHLQTNKVRSIVGKVAMIESVDTEKLLRCIDAEASRLGVIQPVLMQVHVAREETKFGFYVNELLDFFREKRFEQYPAIKFSGIMGMASNTDDVQRIANDFSQIADCHHQICDIAPELTDFTVISMGMSDDYRIAIDNGSNLVRIGTSIFGPREY